MEGPAREGPAVEPGGRHGAGWAAGAKRRLWAASEGGPGRAVRTNPPSVLRTVSGERLVVGTGLRFGCPRERANWLCVGGARGRGQGTLFLP